MIETIETFVLLLFAGLALLAGAGFILFRQPVYAAVSFTATVLSASVLYILLSAAYVAAATMVIYAGATIIIFLFVLMFAQHSNLQQYELKYSNLGPALVATLCLTLLLGYAITTRDNVEAGITNLPLPPQAASPTADATTANTTGGDAQATETAEPARLPGDLSVAALGRALYTRYLWTIELAGTLLLIAACGAIVIAQRESNSPTGASA
jgi:NADH-quinone oxidoreductase subunit J